jgi:hypothetical protein
VEGLEATRRIFVPSSGRFARILDVLHNPGADPVTIFLDLSLRLKSSGSPWEQVTSSGDWNLDAGDQFAVFLSESTRVVALVSSGATGSQRPPLVGAATIDVVTTDVYSAWETLDVPAGDSVIVMQFVAVREPGELDAAFQQAAALADLSDPEALDGLSQAERALIVNFEVP